jgi:hypothetical protein
VKAPFARLSPTQTSSAAGSPPCRGILTRDFQKHIRGGNDPLLTAGARVFAQLVQRDPGDPAGFGDSLTNALRFVVAP